MVGVILLVVAFLVGIPILLMSLGALGAVIGGFLKSDAEIRHEGSELIELNR